MATCKHCGCVDTDRCCVLAAAEQERIGVIRKALDGALREADRGQEDHPWRVGGGYGDCAAHNESMCCCLDPSHGAYGKLLDYLAERICRATMYRDGAVTNVVATVGQELRHGDPGPICQRCGLPEWVPPFGPHEYRKTCSCFAPDGAIRDVADQGQQKTVKQKR